MNFTKFSLAASTALTMSMTAAYADSNEAYLDQAGSGNTALITQDAGSNNNVATAGSPGKQEGQNNDLSIEQSGDNNFIGKPASATPLQQKATNAVGASNTANVLQGSDGNLIDRISQVYTGTNQAVNDLSIVQNIGNGNRIFNAEQNGTGNFADVDMTGTTNFLRVLKQSGNDNNAVVNLSGDQNGSSSALGSNSSTLQTRAFPASGAYAGSKTTVPNSGGRLPLATSSIQQNGKRNDTSLDISGNRTAFGVSQNGDDNDALGIIITGDDNAFSSDQFGDRNMITLSTIAGMSNSIGFAQDGDDNVGAAIVDGDGNQARIKQFGDRNNTALEVGGNNSVAELDVTGNDNFLDAEQRFGNNNEMYVDILGDSNNNSGSLFTGDALASRDAANGATGQLFGRGRLWQHGADNDMTLDVDGDSNLFAALQQGDANAITGTVDGNSNQAVVFQSGDNNVSTFSQIGNNNNMGVTQ